uniref:Uncharacterized protein n=1 Tax=Ralstonia solanacearum CFBP2957 TaxID=859656 RepID=D8P2P6_RALSL|nr:protein of unknown function [Ralstonia solanacearum CFBP2957]
MRQAPRMTTGYASFNATLAAWRAHGAREGDAERIRSGREQRLDGADDVADRADRFEFFRLDAAPRHFLQLDGQIDGVDAVEVEFFEQVRFGRDTRRVDREVLLENGADALQDFSFGHVTFSRSSDGACLFYWWL